MSILCVIVIFVVSPAGSVHIISSSNSASFGSSFTLTCLARGGPNNTYESIDKE